MHSVFDPRELGTPFSIIVGMNDPGYCESKAIELLHEAKLISAGRTDYHERLVKAVSLLVLARAQRGAIQSEETSRPGTKNPE